MTVLLVALLSQAPPYDAAPEVAPPYFRVRYEASAEPGGPDLPVRYAVWVPPGVDRLRGVVVHQHGCGEGSCKSGLTGAFDLHWQALAARHGCALLAAAYEQPQDADCGRWCDPRNGSDAAFRRALDDLGQRSGHPELCDVPWALWGHSGGAYWSGIMTLRHPDRVAAAWLRSGAPPVEPMPSRPSRKVIDLPAGGLGVPMMLNLGTKEGVTDTSTKFAGVWPAVKAFVRPMRAAGSPVGVAVDPLTGHECGNQRYLAIPWMDACLAARLPETPGDPLRPMPEADAWLAPLEGGEAVPIAEFKGDPAEAVWLPNARVAALWAAYVADAEVPDDTPPPPATNLAVDAGTLTWDAAADLESGLRQFVILRDGREIARVPTKPTNPRGRKLFQGLQYSDTPLQPLAEMTYTDPDWTEGAAYEVVPVNTVGLSAE